MFRRGEPFPSLLNSWLILWGNLGFAQWGGRAASHWYTLRPSLQYRNWAIRSCSFAWCPCGLNSLCWASLLARCEFSPLPGLSGPVWFSGIWILYFYINRYRWQRVGHKALMVFLCVWKDNLFNSPLCCICTTCIKGNISGSRHGLVSAKMTTFIESVLPHINWCVCSFRSMSVNWN